MPTALNADWPLTQALYVQGLSCKAFAGNRRRMAVCPKTAVQTTKSTKHTKQERLTKGTLLARPVSTLVAPDLGHFVSFLYFVVPTALPRIRGVDAAGGRDRGSGAVGGYVGQGAEPFYGTRVGPGWYQTATSVPRVRNLPFAVLRMLMQVSCGSPPCRPSCDPQVRYKPFP